MPEKVKILRAWWTRDGRTSKQDVVNEEEAIKWLNKQTELDLYDDSITWNAGGLEEFDENDIRFGHEDEDTGWSEYYNEDGLDIMEIIELGTT